MFLFLSQIMLFVLIGCTTSPIKKCAKISWKDQARLDIEDEKHWGHQLAKYKKKCTLEKHTINEKEYLQGVKHFGALACSKHLDFFTSGWRGVGRSDALNGKSLQEFEKYKKNCQKFMVIPNENDYSAGYKIGQKYHSLNQLKNKVHKVKKQVAQVLNELNNIQIQQLKLESALNGFDWENQYRIDQAKSDWQHASKNYKKSLLEGSKKDLQKSYENLTQEKKEILLKVTDDLRNEKKLLQRKIQSSKKNAQDKELILIRLESILKDLGPRTEEAYKQVKVFEMRNFQL